MLSSHPIPRHVKHALACITNQPNDPSVATDAARTLAPTEPAVALWSFECAIANADIGSALALARDASASHRVRVPVTLARARVLEARGQPARALRMLQRAAGRDPDERLVASAQRLARGMPAPTVRLKMAASHRPNRGLRVPYG